MAAEGPDSSTLVQQTRASIPLPLLLFSQTEIRALLINASQPQYQFGFFEDAIARRDVLTKMDARSATTTICNALRASLRSAEHSIAHPRTTQDHARATAHKGRVASRFVGQDCDGDANVAEVPNDQGFSLDSV
jgi:hypothetical protein